MENLVPYPKLRGRMVEKGISQRELATILGISVTAMSNKMRGVVGFSQSDIVKICETLDIALNDIGSYFYANKVYVS